MPEEHNLFDVVDGETAVLQLADQTNALDRGCVVDALPALGASGLLEETGALVETDCVARHAAARGDVSDA